MAIVLHHLVQSRSERIPWLLEELGIPYEIRVHYREPSGLAPPSLHAVNPLGKAPCITIDGKLFTESGAIVHTLLRRYGSKTPGLESEASEDSVFWSHFAEGSLLNLLQAGRVVQLGTAAVSNKANDDEKKGASKLHAFVRTYVRSGVEPGLAYIEKFLADNPNFSGNDQLGEGDFMLGWSLSIIEAQKAFKLGPATKAWVSRMRQRPAWDRAQQRVSAAEREQKPRAKL